MNLDVVGGRLTEARHFITVGEYDKARQILKPIRKHPTAQRWLEQMDRKYPRRANRLRLVLVGMVVLAVIALAAAVLYVNSKSYIPTRADCLAMQAQQPADLRCEERFP